MSDKKLTLLGILDWNIAMTDRNVIELVHDNFNGDGSVRKKPPGKGQLGKKMQWRWR